MKGFGIIMNGKEVTTFLGEDYHYSSDLLQYIKLLNQFSDIQNNLLSYFYTIVQDKNFVDFAKEKMNTQFREEIKKVIAQLCSKGILNNTVEDYLNKNNGYIKFNEATDAAKKQVLQFIYEQAMSLMNAAQTADNYSMSNVTGGGVDVFTSSPVAYAAFAALDYNKTKRQLQKAESNYKTCYKKMSKEAASISERKEAEYYSNVYFPNVENAISVFSSEFMDNYIKILSEAGMFDVSSIENIDYNKSQQILENVELTNDKIGVLKQAFFVCPFNFHIYEKSIELNVFDLETYKTSELFLGDLVYEYIKSYCKTIIDGAGTLEEKYDQLHQCISILAYKKNSNQLDITKELFEKPLSKFITNYKQLDKMISSKMLLDQWIRKRLNNDIEKVILATDGQIEKAIMEYMDSLISKEDYAFISKVGLFLSNKGFDLISGKSNNSVEEINQFWIGSIKKEISEYVNEAKRRREIMKTEKNKFENKEAELKSEIENLHSELLSSGFFSFSKKKALKEATMQAEAKLQSFVKDNEYLKAKASFEDMYRYSNNESNL